MKNLLFPMLVLLAFVSCSKDDDSSSNNIKKATVGGAKLIYQNSMGTRAGTRATTEEVQRFMTIDDKGEVKPIRFITENGDTLNLQIDKINNLNNDYLVILGYFHFNSVFIEQILVNKNTELIYAMKGRYNFEEDRPTFSDKNNNAYIAYWTNTSGNVLKFDISNPENIIVQDYLPENQFRSERFWINKNGTCYYMKYLEHKFKCSGGRIYNIEELIPTAGDVNYTNVFVGFDQNFYVANNLKLDDVLEIYRLKEIGDNQLEAIKIVDKQFFNVDVREFCPNPKGKTHIGSDENRTVEFNELTGELRELNIKLPNFWCYGAWGDNSNYDDSFVTSESLFVIDGTKLYQLRLADYSLKMIDLINEGYEIESKYITCSINSPGLSFSGLRYSDGKNVIGTINEDGTITAYEDTKSSNKITTLLRLN